MIIVWRRFYGLLLVCDFAGFVGDVIKKQSKYKPSDKDAKKIRKK